jgi:hypothetical protein
MNEERTYYKTTYTFEVLSEEPMPDGISLSRLEEETYSGHCVGRFGDFKEEVLTGKQAADALYEFGSQPEFFCLDDEGVHEDAVTFPVRVTHLDGEVSVLASPKELHEFTTLIMQENEDADKFILKTAEECVAYLENFCANLMLGGD